MKKLLVLLFLVIGSTVTSQEDEFSKIHIIHSPGSWDDGYSTGIQYEHQNRTVYYGGEFYMFPDLHCNDYYHLIGRFGLNTFVFNTDWLRIYSGGRAGGIIRNGNLTYNKNNYQVLLGLEAGVNLFIRDLILTMAVTSDMKTDSKIWSHKEDSHTVNSVLIGIGYRF